MYQRTVHEWERQRLRLEFEHGELLSRVNYLAEEVCASIYRNTICCSRLFFFLKVILEKRLGIAQLCLLLAVLVFMGLTRGAPSVVQPRLNHSTREFGRRNLSFTGSNGERGWNPSGRRSRSPTDVTVGKRSEKHPSGMDPRIEFSARRARRSSDHDPIPRRLPHPTSFAADKRSTPRASTASKHSGTLTTASVFRTPTRRTPAPISLNISTLPRPYMVRTNSHSSQGLIIPKSAKHFARSAHLHEVKGSLTRRESQRERENDSGDVFSVAPMKQQHHSRRPSSPRRPLFPIDLARQPQDVRSEDTTDADAWIETDAEGGSECSEFIAFDPSL
jgi:hypothetical protein